MKSFLTYLEIPLSFKISKVIHLMNQFQLVLNSKGFSLVLDSSKSFLNLEVELSENLANASSKVGKVSSGSEGSGIGSEGFGTEGVFLDSVVA